MLFASAPDLLPFGRLEAGFARQGVPSLWTGVSMGRRGHPRCKDRLHVLSGVAITGPDRERSDLGDAFPARWLPPRIPDRQEPSLSERLNDRAGGRLGYVGRSPRRKDIELPENLGLAQGSELTIRNDSSAVRSAAGRQICAEASWDIVRSAPSKRDC